MKKKKKKKKEKKKNNVHLKKKTHIKKINKPKKKWPVYMKL